MLTQIIQGHLLYVNKSANCWCLLYLQSTFLATPRLVFGWIYGCYSPAPNWHIKLAVLIGKGIFYNGVQYVWSHEPCVREKMKGFLICSSFHRNSCWAEYCGQGIGLGIGDPLCVSWLSFLISLREILLSRGINILSGFRYQLLLEYSERASSPAPGDPQAHGKVQSLLSGGEALLRYSPYASRRGPCFQLAHCPEWTPRATLRLFCSLHQNSL